MRSTEEPCSFSVEFLHLKRIQRRLLSSTGESWYGLQLQKDKLVAVPPVVVDFAWGQNVITAVTFKSVILTAALHKCEDGVLLL